MGHILRGNATTTYAVRTAMQRSKASIKELSASAGARYRYFESEQVTLNHRVPGSSPGAPTKLFKHLYLI
jgi:hypothetical protein